MVNRTKLVELQARNIEATRKPELRGPLTAGAAEIRGRFGVY